MPDIKIRDITLHYELSGRGRPLLLIPGLNADSASWAGVRGHLAGNFRVITIDNRSCGRTVSPPERCSIRAMAGDAAALLGRLGIKRCHVVGHSMGGYIAQELAIRRPDLVDKLVLEATAPVSSKRNIELFKDLLKRFEASGDSASLMRSWTYWLFSPGTFCRGNFIETFVKESSRYRYSQSPAGFRAQAGAIASFDASARIKNIRSATLVVIGADDILICPSESMKLVMGISGASFVTVRGAGHCVHVEEPAEFVSIVKEFLEQGGGART